MYLPVALFLPRTLTIIFLKQKQHRDTQERLEEKINRQKSWWQMNGPKYEYHRALEKKHKGTIQSAIMNISNPSLVIRKVKDKFCEPNWQIKLRENTKKFARKLVSLRFPKLPEKPSFTVGNNIDFCRWGLIEQNLDLQESISIRKEMFKSLWEKAFDFRQNMIVCGIYVDESIPNRKSYHEQIESIFTPDEVGIQSF